MSDNNDRNYKIFIKNQFSSKISNAHADCSFDYYVKKFLTQSPKKSLKVRGWWIKKYFFFKKDLPPQIIPMDS